MFVGRAILAVLTVLVMALTVAVEFAAADPFPLDRPAAEAVVLNGDDKVITGVETPEAVVIHGDDKVITGVETPEAVVIHGDDKAVLPYHATFAQPAGGTQPTGGIDWSDVAIGIGIGAGAALLLAGAGYLVRHPPMRHPPTGRPPSLAAH